MTKKNIFDKGGQIGANIIRYVYYELPKKGYMRGKK